MVSLGAILAAAAAEADKQTVLERLDPERRAAVIMALVGLGILGVLLVVGVLLGGRWARQNRTTRASRLTDHLAPEAQGTPNAPSLELRHGETLAEPPGDGETKV